MKRIVTLCLVLLAAGLLAACSQGGPSSPVAPDTQSLSATTSNAVATGPWPHEGRKVCHHNPDYLTEGGYEWKVIEVNVGGQLNGHCGYQNNRQHGDYTTGGYRSCAACEVDSRDVGTDCSFCTGS